mmetsp:Transcript_147914/g.272881  ORF Transcript_147914/g.272881 Transcript_147914/m.272881 type:complete len:202 (-) Transcript_147914:1618-2223(-)
MLTAPRPEQSIVRRISRTQQGYSPEQQSRRLTHVKRSEGGESVLLSICLLLDKLQDPANILEGVHHKSWKFPLSLGRFLCSLLAGVRLSKLSHKSCLPAGLPLLTSLRYRRSEFARLALAMSHDARKAFTLLAKSLKLLYCAPCSSSPHCRVCSLLSINPQPQVLAKGALENQCHCVLLLEGIGPLRHICSDLQPLPWQLP